GEGAQTKRLESLHMGCVSMTTQFFPDGEITEKRLRRARIAAKLELEPVRQSFMNDGWDQAVGSSGTIRSVAEVLRARGEAEITRNGVQWLIEQALRAGHSARLRLPDLSQERVPVFVGGLAI